MASSYRWTEERLSVLQDRWASGKLAADVAAELGPSFTPKGISNMAWRLRLRRARPGRGRPEVLQSVAPAPLALAEPPEPSPDACCPHECDLSLLMGFCPRQHAKAVH